MKFQIQYIDPRSLIPYESNAKIHSDKQIKALASAIVKRGFDQPVTVDDELVIITGHGRTQAAIVAGLDKIPVIVRDDLTPSQVQAKRLEDNRLSSTDYDTGLMQDEIAALLGEGEDLFGFDARELEMFSVDPLEMAESDAFIADLTEEVRREEDETARISAEVSESRVSLATVFGFKDIPVTKSRMVSNWFAEIESMTGEIGANALVAFIEHDNQ